MTIVMFSGFDHEGLADRAVALGAEAFIEKSVRLDELPERIRAAAEGRVQPAPEGAEEQVVGAHLERFRAVFDQAAIGMATLTLTGRVVRANGALKRLLRNEDVVGAMYADLAGLGHDAMVAG